LAGGHLELIGGIGIVAVYGVGYHSPEKYCPVPNTTQY